MRSIIVTVKSVDGKLVNVCVGDHSELTRARNKDFDNHEKVIAEALQRAIGQTVKLCLDKLKTEYETLAAAEKPDETHPA